MSANISIEINKVVQRYLTLVLENISQKYGIDLEELKCHYINGDIELTNTSTDKPDAAVEKKKRGRKKKLKEELIETREYEFEGVKYLVDNDNNVYTYNIEAPVHVGEKLVDGTIAFFIKE